MATLLFGLVLAACGGQQELPLTTLPGTLVLESYAHGKLISRIEISSSDDVYKKLQALLIEERHGWETNYASIVPGPYEFRSGDLRIACRSHGLLVEFVQDGNPRSFYKKVERVLERLGLPPQDTT